MCSIDEWVVNTINTFFKIVVFFVRGSDELEDTKAQNSIDALELIDATLDEIKGAGVVVGYCGLVNLPKDILVVVDSELENSVGIVTGKQIGRAHV